MTGRLPDNLAAELRSVAAARGQSLNAWATAVLSAAVDPHLAGTEAERLRERLSRAGLLAGPSHRRAHRPDPAQVARAREVAGQGWSLVDLVAEGRG
jgi:plasmid stability protein